MKQYSFRQYVIIAIVLLVGFVFLLRLFYLQVIDGRYKLDAKNQALRYITEFPARGYVFDRDGKLLVYNEAAYDLMVVPRQVKEIDTLQLCELLGMTKETFINKLIQAKKYSRYKPSVFEKQISAESYGALQEKLFKFSGFYVQTRTLRKYPQRTAAHSLGYIGEVSKRITENFPYYKDGDYIGISGVENSYEKELRGIKGMRIVMVDVHNREKGAYKNREYDTLAIAGSHLTATIDAELQKYGEQLMQNKMGSIVAIEPATGEILAIVTSPSYDPNLLVGRVRSKNYTKLSKDTLKPLFNRALMASYPPGSTFKLLQALIGLQEGVLDEETFYSCRGGYYYGGPKPVGCHAHASPVGFYYSIQTSCNAYYCNVFKSIIDQQKRYGSTKAAFNNWRKHVMSFGLGQKIGLDLPNELRGNVPSAEYYDKYHGDGRWKAVTVISLAIGQGEMGITPLQLANYVATIANRGFYYAPRIVKAVDGKPIDDPRYTEKHVTTVDRAHFEKVVEGMHLVVESGTGRAGRLDGIPYCGKTGTAQNPHGKDHSIYISFAPKDNPKIALAVFVENAGFGSTWAVPISSLMIEKYLTDTISRPEMEKRMFEGNLLSDK